MRISGILTFDGREYVVNTPPLEEERYPLVLFLHGGGGSGATFRAQMNIGETLGEEMILVFPTATVNQDAFTAWNGGGPFNPDADDITYFNDLFFAMIATGRVDTDHMYIVGHSNGGMLGYRFICEQPDNWRGLYSMPGDLLVDNPDLFEGKLRETHGTLDENIPIDGGFGAESFYPIDYADLYDVVPSFTRAVNAGIGNLNPLVGYGHDVTEIKNGLISQGTTLQEDIRNFILA